MSKITPQVFKSGDRVDIADGPAMVAGKPVSRVGTVVTVFAAFDETVVEIQHDNFLCPAQWFTHAVILLKDGCA